MCVFKAARIAKEWGRKGFVIAANKEELDHAQQGYDEYIRDTGDVISDWNDNWVIIGQDTELGDPYFVDSSNENLAVHTIIETENGWQSVMVTNSLSSFFECLTLLFNQGQQTKAQFVPTETSISDEVQLSQLKQTLITASGCEPFWTMFFECYLDWLIDEDE